MTMVTGQALPPGVSLGVFLKRIGNVFAVLKMGRDLIMFLEWRVVYVLCLVSFPDVGVFLMIAAASPARLSMKDCLLWSLEVWNY